jgi:site-specific DNA-methyltransferase (adenine-specific)
MEGAGDGGTRNRRTVWSINTSPANGNHIASFPEDLVEPCVLAATRPGDFVLDPFFGCGTVGLVCRRLKRQYIGIELNPQYAQQAMKLLDNINHRAQPDKTPAPARGLSVRSNEGACRQLGLRQ